MWPAQGLLHILKLRERLVLNIKSRSYKMADPAWGIYGTSPCLLNFMKKWSLKPYYIAMAFIATKLVNGFCSKHSYR